MGAPPKRVAQEVTGKEVMTMWPILQGAWMFLSVPELFVITVLLTLLFLIQKLPLSAPKRGMKK